jgi:hypothetical protein
LLLRLGFDPIRESSQLRKGQYLTLNQVCAGTNLTSGIVGGGKPIKLAEF